MDHKSKIMIYGGLAVAALFVISKYGKSPGGPAASVKPTPQPGWPKIGAKELVSATNYTMGQRKPGFVYAPAKKLPNGDIQFTSLVAGYFTRSAMVENGKLYAEVLVA